MTEDEAVIKFLDIRRRLSDVGVTLTVGISGFEIRDCQQARGVIMFSSLKEAEHFCRGYELAFIGSPTCAEVSDDI